MVRTLFPNTLEIKVRVFGKQFFSDLALNASASASFVSRAFTDVSFHELPRGQGRQTKEPPVEAVRDSAHIKCTETHADNEILSKESSCLKIYPFYEQQLCNFLKKLKSLNPEHNILLIFQGQREMQALHPIQGRRWWVGIPVRSWNLAQCQGACLAHTWLQQTFHFFIFYFFLDKSLVSSLLMCVIEGDLI